MISDIKCNFEIVRDVAECKNVEDISGVVVMNCCDIKKTKRFCKIHNLNYILVLSKIYQTNILCCEGVDENICIEQYNPPLGVFLDKSKIFNKSEFIAKFMLELSNFMFDIMQNDIDNLFFYNTAKIFTTKDIVDVNNIAGTLSVQKDLSTVFDIVAKYYLILCIKKSTKELSLLDRVAEISIIKNNKERFDIQTKFLCQNIITSMIKNFFGCWNSKLKSTLNIKKQNWVMEQYDIKPSINTNYLPEQKLEFLLREFKQKLLSYVQQQMSANEKIKNFVADLDVDFLYETFIVKYEHSLTDFVCMEPAVFNKPSILSIMSNNGLLNYEF